MSGPKGQWGLDARKIPSAALYVQRRALRSLACLPYRSEFTIQFNAIRESNMFFTSLILGQPRNVSVETSERLRVLFAHKYEHKLEYIDTYVARDGFCYEDKLPSWLVP